MNAIRIINLILVAPNHAQCVDHQIYTDFEEGTGVPSSPPLQDPSSYHFKLRKET